MHQNISLSYKSSQPGSTLDYSCRLTATVYLDGRARLSWKSSELDHGHGGALLLSVLRYLSKNPPNLRTVRHADWCVGDRHGES